MHMYLHGKGIEQTRNKGGSIINCQSVHCLQGERTIQIYTHIDTRCIHYLYGIQIREIKTIKQSLSGVKKRENVIVLAPSQLKRRSIDIIYNWQNNEFRVH